MSAPIETKVRRWAGLFDFSHKTKGDDLVMEALAHENRSTFGSFFGFAPTKKRKYENAALCYIRAANLYKLDECYDKAAHAFADAAFCFNEADAFWTEVASSLLDAAKSFRQANNTNLAIKFFLSAEKYNVENGRFSVAAVCATAVAELLEQEGNYEASCNNYMTAINCYFFEGNLPVERNKCLIKLAKLQVLMEKYSSAANSYYEAADSRASRGIDSMSRKDFIMCVLSYMAANSDIEFIGKEVDKYEAIDTKFGQSIESKFVNLFLEVYKKGDVDKFAQTCAEYDTKFPADPTLTNIWLQIKTNLESKQDKDLS
jgi:hypothetical protein